MALKTCLIDTGPFVAYLNKNDPMHVHAAEFIDGFKGLFTTTSAVISEVMYFVSESEDGPVSFAQLLLESGARVADFSQPRQILAAATLMRKYGDTPMDFADATLVLLAGEIGVTDILTLDRRGFSTYRTEKGRAFRLMFTLASLA